MIKKNFVDQTKIQSKYPDLLLKSIEKIPEINECEYVFIDDLSIKNINTGILENKILITQNNSKDYLMFDINDIEENGKINNITKLESQLVVDLVILNKQVIPQDMENFIDQDTIITKYLGNNIIFMEDNRNNICIFITEHERFIIKGNGVETQMLFYENLAQ